MASLSLDQGVPEGVPVDNLDLSAQESRSYPRWYTDLLLRKRTEAVSINDALTFIDNFGVTETHKQQLLNMYPHGVKSLDPGQFYVFLRLTSHLLHGVESLTQELIFSPAPIPQPKSILSTGKRKVEHKNRQNIQNGNKLSGDKKPSAVNSNPFRKVSLSETSSTKPASTKMDLDSFTKFLMTGNMPQPNSSGGVAASGSAANALSPPSPSTYTDDSTPEPDSPRLGAKKKKVMFDSEPPQVAEAAARSMEELMRQRAIQQQLAAQFPNQMSQLSQGGSQDDYDEELDDMNDDRGSGDKDEEEDVEIPSNVFRNVTIDSVLHNGVSEIAGPESYTNGPALQSLTPGIHVDSLSPSPSPPITSQDALNFARRFSPIPATTTTSTTNGPPLPPKTQLAPNIANITSGVSSSSSSTSSFFNNPSVPSIESFMPSETTPSSSSASSTTQPTSNSSSHLYTNATGTAGYANGVSGGPSNNLSNNLSGPNIPSIFFPGGMAPTSTGSMNSSHLGPDPSASLPDLSPYTPHPNNLHQNSSSQSLSPTARNGAYMAPPPPAPRRGATATVAPSSSSQVRYFSAEMPHNRRPIPPPPPPSRNRASSWQNPVSSAPNLLSDINSLPDEVERLRVGR